MKPQLLSDTFVSSAYLRRRARRAALLQPGVAYPGHQPTGNGIQALIAPEVQNTYNNGLGRDKLLGDFAMIDILIPAWDFQQADDKIVLHWGTFFSQTFNFSGTPGAQLIRVAGSDLAGDPVPGSDRFTGDGTHQVWYELITAGATPYSDAVDITVKCARPGGIDPRPDTPNLNENLRPATCTPNPIDESAILATFTIPPWDNMERDDTLSLYVAGRSSPGKAIVVGRPQEIELSTAELRNWITPGPAVPVTYEIIDRVGNRSRFAPYLDLDMWLPKEPQLEAPAFCDANGHELPGPLDPGMGTLLVRVPRYLGWVAGEHVTVNLVSYDADHKRDARDMPPKTWQATDYYLDVRVPDDVLPPLGGGTLLAGYTTTRDDRPGTSVASYLRQIQVIEGPVSKLPAVSLPQEKDGKLILPENPGDVVDITVPDSVALVEYARVTLRMSGAASKTQSRDIAQGDGHKPLTFHWTRADLAPAIDASVTFTYTIEVRGRTEVYESEPHTVRVLAEDVVDPPDPELLPAPRIPGRVGGVLPQTLPEMDVTVPIGEASEKDALVTVIANGSTTERRTTRLFGREEATVQFDGWPAKNDGLVAVVSYEVQPPAGALRTSEKTAFLVGDPIRLPTPTFKELVGDVLDVSNTATLHVDPWPSMAVGQKVWCTVNGEDTNGRPTTTTLWTSAAVIARELRDGCNKVVSEAWLKALKDGSDITIAFSVTFDQSDIKDNAVVFPVKPYRIKNLADFVLDQSEMKLEVGGTGTRTPTGGQPPYRYTSSSADVATVNSSGTVTAVKAGTAGITVRDSATPQNSGVYTVGVVFSRTDDFEDQQSGKKIAIGETWPVRSMSITNLRGPSQFDAFRQLPPYAVGIYLSLNLAGHHVVFTPHTVARRIAFGTIADIVGSPKSLTLIAYSHLAEVGRETFTLTGKGMVGRWISFSTAVPFDRVELITSDGWFGVDNLEFN
ncbi:Ig-like domain-containing protein [Luteibacter sp.]|uniref:Ig-like domain-containing protein n=1 Tax=Luteibacter sp. TaxID=1886636 RepID=UPI003F803016